MKKFIIGLVVLMSVLIVGSIYIYQQAHAPYASAKEESIAYVTDRTDLTQPDEFYWYNGSETYFTVKGLTSNNEEMIYIVRQNGGNILSIPAEETLSKEEAIQQVKSQKNPEKILNATIGMIDGRPIWEISYRNENRRLGYYIIDLKTGEWMRTIDNI
ncbi:DUF5590 domain-containing protein [Alkalibacterium iburiense]|uniref:DUF5590 domain-containing protein n=1 Tax=Alkalibacterium iburiense TaxID=290589 RepID=A0ABP3GX92_9LACT